MSGFLNFTNLLVSFYILIALILSYIFLILLIISSVTMIVQKNFIISEFLIFTNLRFYSIL